MQLERLKNILMYKPTKSGHRNSVYSFYMSKNTATNLRKMTLYNPNLDLININVYTIFGLILFILCHDIEQNQILTIIKGRNSVANLRKMKLYNPKIDLINDNVHTIWLNSVHLFSRY